MDCERSRADRSSAASRHPKRVLKGHATPAPAEENQDERLDWRFEVLFGCGDGYFERTGGAGHHPRIVAANPEKDLTKNRIEVQTGGEPLMAGLNKCDAEAKQRYRGALKDVGLKQS
jgi:hypothetical protein